MIGQTVSHYRILERLGSGGRGVVYQAEDVKLSRPTALKFLPPDRTNDRPAVERFLREAELYEKRVKDMERARAANALVPQRSSHFRDAQGKLRR